MNDIERFFYDKKLVITYLSQPDRVDDKKLIKFRLITEGFPPTAREEIYAKDSRAYEGCVARTIDPKLASELIRSGILVSDGEKRFKIRPAEAV